MEYRKDIQILRGIAVLLVVLFHFGLAGFQSGFLGVDVFFVISGYLMAVFYDQNNKKSFFKRRALRLLPAYYVTIGLTVLVSIIILTPNEYKQVFNQTMYADVFGSNIGYWMKNSYFSKTEFNPLLHLWSLGVEIQYYLIIPLLYFILRKKKSFFWLIFSSSIVLCFIVVEFSPKTSFFMMPLRVWEFLIGYGINLYFADNGNIRKSKTRQGIGSLFLLIILAIPFFEVKESLSFITGHPGLYALLINLSTGAVLALGINQHFENSFLGTLLERIGKYSYSLYLVHYPILVLYLYKPFSGTNLKISSLFDLIFLITFIAIATLGMYHFVETKLRSHKKITTILYIFPILIILVSVAGLGIQRKFHSSEEMLIFDAFTDRSIYRCGKMFRILNPGKITCEITTPDLDRNNNIMLVGNSHADSIKTSFADTANQMNTGLYFLVPNNPLMNSSIVDSESVVSEAMKYHVSTIVLHYSLAALSADDIHHLVDTASKKDIRVFFIMPIPTWKEHIPLSLWEHYKYDKPLETQTLEDYQNKTAILKESLMQIKSDNFKIYEVGSFFCDDECAIVDSFGSPLYFDSGHLTLTGSKLLTVLFENIVNDSIMYNQQH